MYLLYWFSNICLLQYLKSWQKLVGNGTIEHWNCYMASIRLYGRKEYIDLVSGWPVVIREIDVLD